MLELIKNSDNNPEFIYISTDEVYWEIISGSFSENSEIKASNVYAATKVAAEQLVFAYWKTNWLKYKICRSTNNYWYWQDAEKLLAKTIKYSLEWKKMTIHWDWKYFREWIYVWDNVAWIFTVLEKWSVGEVYNIWSGVEYDNLTMVKKVLKEIWLAEDFYENVKNRKWQDIRYSLDSSKIRKLWWEPKMLVDDYISIYIDKTKNKDEGRFL
jgi:dTDP-glucose 4,6-dehydratase